MFTIGNGAEREMKDYALTRYACYLVAQNGDSSKRDDNEENLIEFLTDLIFNALKVERKR